MNDLSWSRFGELSMSLVEQISRDYQPEIVVGIAKGGLMPAVVIASAFSVDLFPVKLSSRHNEEIVREIPEMFVPPTQHVANKRVLLVDDICITLRTLNIARQAILDLGAAEVRTATLAVHRFSKRPDWYVIESDDLLIHPWDRNMFVSGKWIINPEYQAELDEMGVTLRG
ncbi:MULTISPECIES: phosphoribosyltransferase [unclassified Bradyrhizobium]|uniref:phosphoribosyltransferase n=1 Tax=unclassified Bradyrhizobium TaxID=2631580 RepID=UPI0028E53E66|nr:MULTISPECIES: phosphoribosyltransferase family protein [unclassified Bradyrhizobium]